MDDDLAALTRCVGDVDAFARESWGQAPMLRRRSGPFDDLLDLQVVETLLATSARRPTFRLVQDGVALPVSRYTMSIRLGGGTVDDAADLGRIAELVGAGATLVMQGLQRTWLPLARFCRSLERATSHAVQANAYLTPSGAVGLKAHSDTHDVMVLQVSGSKSWDIEGMGPLELAAGDVLYLPTGTTHAAAAQAETSLHITLGILCETYRQALHRALADADLDRPLPLGFARPDSATALAAGLREAVSAATAHLVALDPATLSLSETARALRRRRPLWTGHLRSVLAAAALDDTTRVRRRADNPAVLSDVADGSGRVRLALDDRRLYLPPQARAALDFVLGRSAFVVGELPGLDGPGRAVLARRLVREGLLEIVAPTPGRH